MERFIDLDMRQVRSVLPILLQDRTTKRHIIWATDTYAAYGEGYGAKDPITAALITGENSRILQPRIAKAVSEQADRTKKHAEVFTPAWICSRMVNYCDEVWFGRGNVFNTDEGKSWTPADVPVAFPKRKRWQRYVDSRRLEITCGEAPYLVSRYDASTGEPIPFRRRIGILDRKLRVVNENAADEAEWLKYAFRALESVYGFEYQGDNLLIARVNVLMTFMEAVQEKWQREATPSELQRAAKIISWNLWQMDGLKGIVPHTSLQEANAQVSIWELLGEMPPAEAKRPECRIYDWRGQGKLTYNDRMTRKGKEMKFDFVIGNPPYQDETVGEQKMFTPPVYNLFLTEAYKLSDRVLMIHPARFLFNAGSTPKAWNKKMLSDPHFKVIFYEQDSSKIFSNTDIKGGIAISYRDAAKDFGAIEVFTHFVELNQIRQKAAAKLGEHSLADIIYVQNRFNLDALYSVYPEYRSIIGSDGKDKRFRNNIFEKIPLFSTEKKDDTDVPVFGILKNKRVWRYLPVKYLELSHPNFEKYKVLVPRANGSGAIGEVLSTPLIADPLIGYTQSFIGIGSFDTEYEATAAMKYVKSKFARCLLGILKITQDNDREVWRCIPLQNFTPTSDIDWSASVADIDRQLYHKYSLTEEEIAFIETKVKEMA